MYVCAYVFVYSMWVDVRMSFFLVRITTHYFEAKAVMLALLPGLWAADFYLKILFPVTLPVLLLFVLSNSSVLVFTLSYFILFYFVSLISYEACLLSHNRQKNIYSGWRKWRLTARNRARGITSEYTTGEWK